MRHVRSSPDLWFHSLSGVILFTLLPSLAVTEERSYLPPPSNVLYINGEFVGYPYTAAGGYAVRRITSNILQTEKGLNWATSLSAGIEYPPVEMSFGGDMLPGWYNWLASELGNSQTPEGSVTLLRTNGTKPESQVSGSVRLLEIEFPALDRAEVGTTHFRARLELSGQPQISLSPPGPVPVGQPPAVLMPSTHEFRLSLQGLEATTYQAVSVSGFKVTRPGAPGYGRLTASPIVVRLPQQAAIALQDWYVESVLAGNPNATLRQGKLEYMNGKGRVVAAVGLVNVGMLGFSPVSHKGFPLVEMTLHAQQVIPPAAAPGK